MLVSVASPYYLECEGTGCIYRVSRSDDAISLAIRKTYKGVQDCPGCVAHMRGTHWNLESNKHCRLDFLYVADQRPATRKPPRPRIIPLPSEALDKCVCSRCAVICSTAASPRGSNWSVLELCSTLPFDMSMSLGFIEQSEASEASGLEWHTNLFHRIATDTTSVLRRPIARGSILPTSRHVLLPCPWNAYLSEASSLIWRFSTADRLTVWSRKRFGERPKTLIHTASWPVLGMRGIRPYCREKCTQI